MADTYVSTDATYGQTLPEYVSAQAEAAGLDPAFVSRLVHQESAFNPSAVSPKGAQGLMQLMPATAAQYGVTNLMDPAENVKAGIAHLKRLTAKYGGDLRMVAAAYNAGEGAVEKAGGVPPFPETKHYVDQVAPESAGYVSTDPTYGDYVSTDPTYGSAKQGDLKKSANVAAYQKDYPSLWSKITDKAKGVVEGAKALVTSPDARAAFGTSVMNNPITQAGIGAVKEGVSRVDAAADVARRNIPGVAALDAVVPPVQLPGTPTLNNPAQKVGAKIEHAAEFVPALSGGSGLVKAVLPTGARLAAKIAAQAAVQGGISAGLAKSQGDSAIVGGVVGATGGALEPVAEAVAPALSQYATGRMRAAVKAGNGVLRDLPVSGPGVPFNQRAMTLAKYILDKDLTPETAQTLVRKLGDQLNVARASASAQVAEPAITQEVTNALKAVADKYGHSPVSADLEAMIEKLYTTKPGPMVAQPSAILGPNGQPIVTMKPGPPVRVPRTDVTRDEALQIAQDMRGVKWGERGTPGQEAGKAVESTLRTVAKNSPEIAAAQKPYGMALVAAKALDKAATRIGNREAVSPFTHVMDVAGLVGAIPTGGLSLVPSAISRYMQKHPIEAARTIRSLSDALASRNVTLTAKILSRMGIGAASQVGGGE